MDWRQTGFNHRIMLCFAHLWGGMPAKLSFKRIITAQSNLQVTFHSFFFFSFSFSWRDSFPWISAFWMFFRNFVCHFEFVEIKIKGSKQSKNCPQIFILLVLQATSRMPGPYQCFFHPPVGTILSMLSQWLCAMPGSSLSRLVQRTPLVTALPRDNLS